jgi:DNA-binding XRE family transcriptional regulator
MGRETLDERHDRIRRAGRWLRQERDGRGWTQADLAERLAGVSQHAVSAFERGAYEVEAGIARDIAKVFGLSEYEVWRGLEIPLPAEVASRRRLISYAFSLMNNKDAEDLFDLVGPQIRAKLRGGKGGGAQVKSPRVTRPGGNPSSGSQGEESAV